MPAARLGTKHSARPGSILLRLAEMLSLAILALSLPQGTHIVDAAGGPGSNFLDIPPAVSAAASGDTILVRAGTYSGFTTSKALRVLGAGASLTTIIGAAAAVEFRNTPAGQTSLLAGCECRAGTAAIYGGVVLYYSDLTILDCDVYGSPLIGLPALRSDFSTVHASRCTFTGSDSPTNSIFSNDGGAGAFLRDTFFSAEQCSFQGGDGFLIPPANNVTLAGHGISVGESEAVLSRCDVFGGRGPYNWNGHAVHCWAGTTWLSGDASNVCQGGESATLFGASHLGVQGTIAVHGAINVLPSLGMNATTLGAVTLGEPEFPFLDVQGTSLPNGTIDAAQPAAMTYEGLVPNAPFFFLFGFARDHETAIPVGQVGPLLVDIHTAGLVFGTLDSAGQFSFPVPTTLLAPVYGIPIHSQAGTYDLALGLLRTSNGNIERFGL